MIGVFDSGIGGLTVLKEFLARLPQYDYLYLGDTARTPYGNRSQELIYCFAEQAVDFLFKQGCQLVIIACNTASSEALRKIQQEYLPKRYPDRRVLGVIRPVVEAASEVTKNNRVAVIGTRGTINSKAYERELKKLKSEITVIQKACPLLVPLVEEGALKKPYIKQILKSYLQGLKTKNIDTLILGCTHYPVLEKQIKTIMGRHCQVLNTAEIVAEKLTDYLKRHPEIESRLGGADSGIRTTGTKLLFTDITPHCKNLAQQILKKQLPIEKLSLEELQK